MFFLHLLGFGMHLLFFLLLLFGLYDGLYHCILIRMFLSLFCLLFHMPCICDTTIIPYLNNSWLLMDYHFLISEITINHLSSILRHFVYNLVGTRGAYLENISNCKASLAFILFYGSYTSIFFINSISSLSTLGFDFFILFSRPWACTSTSSIFAFSTFIALKSS